MWMAEDEIGARDHLHVFDDGVVSLVRVDLLGAPVGEGVRGGRRQAQAVLAGKAGQAAADHLDLGLGFLDVVAHARAGLDDRLVHFGLDALGEHGFALLDHLQADVGAEVTGLRIDGLILLLDADRQAGLHGVFPLY